MQVGHLFKVRVNVCQERLEGGKLVKLLSPSPMTWAQYQDPRGRREKQFSQVDLSPPYSSHGVSTSPLHVGTHIHTNKLNSVRVHTHTLNKAPLFVSYYFVSVFFVLLIFCLYILISDLVFLWVLFLCLSYIREKERLLVIFIGSFGLFGFCCYSLFFKKREGKGVELGGWRDGEELRGAGAGEIWPEYIK